MHERSSSSNPSPFSFATPPLTSSNLDNNGKYAGRPIRASFFDSKPTLDSLEKKFRQNQSLKQDRLVHVICNVGDGFYNNRNDLDQFTKKLRMFNTEALPIYDKKTHQCIDLYYIDHRNGCVWNSKDLPPSCSKEAYLDLVEKNDTRIQNALKQKQCLVQEEELRQRQRITRYLS